MQTCKMEDDFKRQFLFYFIFFLAHFLKLPTEKISFLAFIYIRKSTNVFGNRATGIK